jgi:hypothetical protein
MSQNQVPRAVMTTMADRQFPIMDARGSPGGAIPWSLIAPHELQAIRNHDQTLERLAQRGGLVWSEAYAVLIDSPWRDINPHRARSEVLQMVASQR